MWTFKGNGSWLPLLFPFALALAGLGILLRKETAPVEPSDRGEDACLLSHEMKNYLCTLKGNAHLLRQRVPSDDHIIIDRIDRVVAKLESFTLGMSGAKEAAIATGTLRAVRPAEAAQACVRTHFHKDLEAFRFEAAADAHLEGDPDRLEQVFLNLYANSLEAGARTVTTRVERAAGKVLVRIEDDGKGCAREDLARIFEPFFTTKSGPARRGLGMFIVQAIVENHGGRIRVGTKNGSEDGSTGLIFSLEFPLPAMRPAPLGAHAYGKYPIPTRGMAGASPAAAGISPAVAALPARQAALARLSIQGQSF
jgi:signal transduction histidine kinase